jgi:hypothetical protein
MAQYKIWCPPLVRDKFDEYCNSASAADQKRADRAFEAFHNLFADDAGCLEPPVNYNPAPAIPPSAEELEIRVHGVRFLASADFVHRRVWLEGITI